MSDAVKKEVYFFDFPGFYETILKFDDEYLEEEDQEKDVDHKEYEKDVALAYVEKIKKEINFSELGIKNIEFKRIVSPQYYNYGNDELELKIDVNMDVLKKYLESNKKDFSAYIEAKNKSYDGFISYMDQGYKEYIEKLDHENHISQIMQYYTKKYFESIEESIEEFTFEALENICVCEYII